MNFKEKISTALGSFGMILIFIFGFLIDIIGVMPILYFRFPYCWVVAGIAFAIFRVIKEWSRIPVIILYVAGLFYVINLPQDWTSTVYYILFGLVVVFEIIPLIMGFISVKKR